MKKSKQAKKKRKYVGHEKINNETVATVQEQLKTVIDGIKEDIRKMIYNLEERFENATLTVKVDLDGLITHLSTFLLGTGGSKV